MKLVIAPDSFKESLSARAVAEAIAAGWARVYPDSELLLCPMADGGEGTVDALLSATGGMLQQTRVSGPLGDPVEAHWGLLPNAQAIIEMAEASGLHRVEPGRRDVLAASSHGTGELIRAALDAGVRRIVLGLGGSATNDGGAGLLEQQRAKSAALLGTRFVMTASDDHVGITVEPLRMDKNAM